MKKFVIAAAIVMMPVVALAKTTEYTYNDRTECSAYYTTLGTIGDFKDLAEDEAHSWAPITTHEDEIAHPEDDIMHSGKIFHDASTQYRRLNNELPRNPSDADIAAFRAKYDHKCRAIAKQQCALIASSDYPCVIYSPQERAQVYSTSSNRH